MILQQIQSKKEIEKPSWQIIDWISNNRIFLKNGKEVQMLSDVRLNIGDSVLVYNKRILKVDKRTYMIPTIKTIEIEKALLLFLISNSSHFIVWELKNDNGIITLNPYEPWNGANYGGDDYTPEWYAALKFDLSKYTKETELSSYYFRYNSVLQSNPNINEHRYTVCNVYNSGKINTITYNQWANRETSWIYGFKEDYEKIGYNINASYIFNSDNSYIGYYNSFNTPLVYPIFICSSRHPSIIFNGGVIKNLELWCIDATHAQIKYTDSSGNKTGSLLDFSASSYQTYKYFAILSPNLYIGHSGSTAPYNNTTYVEVTPGIYCDTCWIEEPLIASQTIHSGGYSYSFGNYLIDSMGTSSSINNSYSIIVQYGTNVLLRYTIHDSIIKSSFKVLNYDNLNIDETFILFYEEMINHTWGTATNEVCNDRYISGDGGESTTKKTYLVYKTKNMLNPIQIEISSGVYGYTIISHNVFPGGDNPYYCDPPIEYVVDSLSQTSSGTRIKDPTCKINEDYIIYTYIIEDYAGVSGELHWNDYKNPDPNWIFSKRIIGIIDIKTSVITEQDITDEFLGDWGNYYFDQKYPAAIGLHNLNTTVTQ